MQNIFLPQIELFLYFDRNIFQVWSCDKSINTKYELKANYEPIIQRIDGYKNIIACIISSREREQEILVFRVSKTQNTLKLLSKKFAIRRVCNLKLLNHNKLLLINLTNIIVFDYQKQRIVKRISLLEPYHDKFVISRYFPEINDDLIQQSKMYTYRNSSSSYVNIFQRSSEQQLRIFSLNPCDQENNFIGIFQIKSNFFSVIQKNVFITNSINDNTLIVYQYDPQCRKINILYQTSILFMNKLKVIQNGSMVINMNIGLSQQSQQQLCMDFYKIKLQKQKQTISKEPYNELVTGISLHLLKVEKINYDQNLLGNACDLEFITQNKQQYFIGYINSQNNLSIHFTKLINVSQILNNMIKFERQFNILAYCSYNKNQLQQQQQYILEETINVQQ